MLERLIQEVRRREKPVRIFPNIFPNKDSSRQPSWIVGALLAEKHGEWSRRQRCWTMDEFYQWREQQTDGDTEDPQSESSDHSLQPT